MPRDRRVGGHGAPPEHHGDRLRVEELAAGSPGRERGVVGEHGAGADGDRVGGGAAAVHVGARRGAGDPLARAVGCRGAAVEARRPLHGHVRAAVPGGEEPVVEHGLDLVGEHAGRDLDARVAQPLGAAGGVLAGVGDRVDDAADAGVDERDGARAGAARVVAGLERDDGGGALARRPARACESASTSAWAVPAPRCQPSASTSPCGERITHPTRGLTPRAGPRVARSRARRIAAASAIVARPSSSGVLSSGLRGMHRRCRGVDHRSSTAHSAADTCRLPSGLSPSVPEFHRFNRSRRPLGLTLAARGLSPPVRTYTDPGARFSCRF